MPKQPRSCRLGVRGSCGARPLRQSYITPHCPQCPPVAALKLRLVPVTASRPSGEGNRRYAKLPSLERSHSRRRFPVAFAPYAPPSGSLVAIVAPGHQSGAARSVSGQWPAASHVVCAPAHPWGPAASRLWPRAGLPVRPPRGLPQPARTPYLTSPIPTATERN